MAFRLQALFDLGEVVNLAVQDDGRPVVLIEHWLAAGLQVDDRQPPVAQGDRGLQPDAALVRPPVMEPGDHGRQPLLLLLGARLGVDETGYAAHTRLIGQP